MPKQTAIEQLNSIKGLKFECPCCSSEVAIKRANLFDMRGVYPLRAIRIVKDRVATAKQTESDISARQEKLASDKIARPLRHERGAHSSNLGKQMEHVIPAFLTFPYRRDECRVVLQPIDYLVFQGLSNNGQVEALKFIEVKTGKGVLNAAERCVQAAVAAASVKHTVVKS